MILYIVTQTANNKNVFFSKTGYVQAKTHNKLKQQLLFQFDSEMNRKVCKGKH